MKLNKLSLSLAITLALGSTFGMAHAETTTTTKAPVVTNAKASTHTTTAAKTTAKTTHAKTTAAKTTPAATAKSTTTTDKTTTTAKTTQKSEAPAKAKETLPAGVYPDTKDNWARDAIQAMTQAGYLSGYADNTFKPSAQITREQAAAIYGKVLQHNLNEQELAEIATKESSTSYSDVEADRWSSSAIKLVSAAGVMEGTSKTAFTPSKTMDREQFVASAASLAKKLNLSTPVKAEKVTFKDEASISSAYLADIQYMAQRGIVASGATENFNPKQPVTRAQAATILNRMLNGAGLATPKHSTTEAKAETTVKEDIKKADTAIEKEASKVNKDAKKDMSKTDKDMKKEAEKADKVAKAEAKKADKDLKGNKNAAVAEKAEPTHTVRPVRRSTLKALDQKQQAALEDKVFSELNKTYKTEDAFQNYGVMYWRDNQLHVALKTDSDISTVKANLANRGDSTVNNYVVVESSQYSQAEYDAIDTNFRNYYNKNEKAGTILATFPDVENNQLYAVVSTASKETQQGISKLFGSKVKMTVKR